MLGPGGLARWTAEADARVREGAWGAYASRPVVDLISDRPPDPERDIVLWRDGLARTAGFSGFGGALRVPPRARTTRDAAQLSESYGDEAVDEASGDEHDAPSTVELTRGAPRELRDETLSRKEKEKEEGGVAARVSAARLSAALRRLAAPSAFAATRAVAAHSMDALDRRIAGTARRARATRDETTAALAVSALRERARDGRRRCRAPSSETVVYGQPSTFAATDADDASSLSSFAAADSDDGERNENVTLGYETSRRTPKAPPFPSPAIETARAFLESEKRAGEAGTRSAESPPADALERFHGSAFFLTQRLDAATRPAGDSGSRPRETEEDEIDAVTYPAAAAAAVARARARREASKKATRREDREATARSRRAAAVAAEVARLARRRRELAGESVSRRSRPEARRRVEDAPRNPTSPSRARTATGGPASSARRRATDLVFFAGKGDAAARVFETSRKQRRTKRVNSNRRRLGDEDPSTQKTRSTKKNQPADRGLPANARRVLDLAWNPSATTPDGASLSLPAEDVSAFGPPTPKPPSLLPFSPANADACARAGDSASSRRLRDWCAYAGLATRAEATDGHRAAALKRAYLDALRTIEALAPGVTAAAAAVTAAETKRRHAEARARTGTNGKHRTPSARRAASAAAVKPSNDDVARRNPRWKT